jgi:hypothetical protein
MDPLWPIIPMGNIIPLLLYFVVQCITISHNVELYPNGIFLKSPKSFFKIKDFFVVL